MEKENKAAPSNTGTGDAQKYGSLNQQESQPPHTPNRIETEDLEKNATVSHQEHRDEISPVEAKTPGISGQSPTESKKPKNFIVSVLLFLKEQWFLVTMALLIIIASQVQVPQKQQKMKSLVVSYLCTAIIFLVTGFGIKTRTLIDNLAKIKIHLWVQIQSFLLTSAIMFGVVSAAASNKNFMDPGLLVGMILTGCVATTISSNVVMTGQAHGTQALTVVQSTLGNFLSPFLTPLLFKAYLSTGAWYTHVLPEEPGGYTTLYKRVFKQLGLSVFIPMVSLWLNPAV
jgi:sodium/bile acid cotransporter 7